MIISELSGGKNSSSTSTFGHILDKKKKSILKEKKGKIKSAALHFCRLRGLWQYGLWSFQTEYTKLERFLHKNQHTERKLLNFENWTNGEPQ